MATPRYLLVVGAMFLFIDGCFSFPGIKPSNNINAKEDLPIGHSLGTFYVEDSDHPGSTFIISLIPSEDNPLNLTILNGTHFNFTLSKKLDREASSLKYITVEIDGNEIRKFGFTMYLIILDVNDVHPQFKNLPYTVSLPEDSVPPLLIYSMISATDPDEGIGGQFNLSLQAQIVEYQNTFIMNNTNDGKVYLNRLLDFESVNVYHYFVIAMDGGGLNSTADLFITVTDIQDSAPYFNGIPYMTAINENTNISTVISGLQVKAADGDKGNPNPVTYSILKDTCQNAFAIDNITGNITVETYLDRDEGILVENNGICQLTVVAQETPMSLPANSSTTSVRITVTDLNDNSPTFNSDHYTANISENMPAGIPVTFEQNMNVSDKDQGDNSNFDLTLEPSNVFDIIPNNVQSLASILIRVKNENALDYEKNTFFVITVTAKESKTNLKRSSSATVTINVIDVNDNAPQFSEALSNISISENIPNGSLIITFNATDADSGDFGDVTYSLQVDDEAFTINSKTGEIRTAKELDREIRSTYFLTVVAKDGGGRRNSRQLSIIVTDVNDNSPHFLQLSYAANIKENSKVFVPTLTVSANDDDVGENGRVTYSIVAATPEVLSNFSIDNHNGSITVKNNLDYEGLMNTNGEITLTVEASDNGTPPKYENVTVFIRVQDINDNTPAFNQRNFTATVAENATPGFVITSVKAMDGDGSAPNNAIFYSILRGDLGKFRINSNTGEITCSGKLDAETNSKYIITINAQDRGNPPRSTNSSIEINVSNINDEKPTFNKAIYTASVHENDNNTNFFSLSATDSDSNSELRYVILWSQSKAFDEDQQPIHNVIQNWFAINTKNGTISTTSGIDRETVEKCSLVIMVNDTHGVTKLPQTASYTLSITIEDRNDNPPVFVTGSNYTAEITENMQTGIPLTLKSLSAIRILDKDKGNNSMLSLEIKDYSQNFEPDPSRIESSGSIILKIKNNSILDYEQNKQLIFTLIVKETLTNEQHSNTATVTLNILDVNDNDPVFTPKQYNVSIPENKIQGHVITINATDADSNDFGSIKFFLQGGQGLFTIDTQSGEVMISGSLDYELKQTYYLTVVAADGGGRRQTAPLTINIIDVNDNAPKFLRSDYQGQVKENSTSFDSPLQIKAIDKDKENTPYSSVTYTVVGASPSNLSSFFAVNSTSGLVSLTQRVDYEPLTSCAGKINLILKGCDHGKPQLCSNVSATITVQDINDFTPSFLKTAYYTNVQENIMSGGSVITVNATDSDGSAPNNAIVYIIKSGGGDKFRINSATGLITRAGKLDRESVESFSLIVLAMDMGTPSRTGSVMVHINVTDVNDELPVFPNPNVQISVSENLPKQTVMFMFTAHDGDQDANLNYSIKWDKAKANDDEGNSINVMRIETIIQIDSGTGGVRVTGDLDREQVERITLPIHVVDMNAENIAIQTAEGTLTINIQDANDNNPTFSNSTVMATITENSQPGIPISFTSGELTVFDKDKGQNGTFRLTLLDYNTTFEPVPEIVRSIASVIVRVTNPNALDYEARHNMTIRLVARETSTARHSSTCTILLTIKDANDNPPTFNSSSYSVNISENNNQHKPIIQVMAFDKDSEQYGMGKYILQEQDVFWINESTGELFSVDPLDAETQTQYKVNIEAVDKGERSTQVKVTINVLDVNDQHPVFRRDRYDAIMKENSTNFIRPVKVEATDGDVQSPNNDFEFSFINTSHTLENNFTLDPQSGIITPKPDLDYEQLPKNIKGIIKLLVKVEDKGSTRLSNVTSVIITVEDENDEVPVFTLADYVSNISESIHSDTHVTTVLAEDKDGTLQNSKVFYELSGSGSDKFRINSKTGEIVQAGELDRETVSLYNLTVIATDRGTPPNNGSSTVHITIIDVNDELPKFTNNSVDIRINENVPNGTVVNHFTATDPDTNPSLNYSIMWDLSGGFDSQHKKVNIYTLKSVFDIGTTNGIVFIKGLLDREKVELVTLTVKVKDTNGITPQTATALLTITILDVNDNSPHFNLNHTYNASVTENMPLQIPITFSTNNTMTVKDKDKDNNSIFSLTLLDYPEYFEIVPQTVHSSASVQIRVQNNTILDYEKNQNLTIKIQARETQTKERKSNTATIFLTIKDANDNKPKFENTSYAVSIKENTQNSNVIKITATDDDSEPYGMGTYTLQGGENKFAINETTGQVYIKLNNTKDILDREKTDTYYLTIIASDKQSSKTTVPLKITLTDMNDEKPQFDLDEYEITLDENVAQFPRPLQIQATDKDEVGNQNSNVTYNITKMPTELLSNFSINETSGVISLTGPLDYENLTTNCSGDIQLVVSATDHGVPANTVNVNVTIHVQDINDETPHFVNQLYNSSILENAMEGTYVSTISAIDHDGKDPNNVVFYLIDSGGSDKFRVNSKNGNITVQRGAKLDRETEPFYKLTVIAMDRGSPPRSSSATVSVTIEDVNDVAPEFDSIRNSISVYENRTKDSHVFDFSAFDDDLDANLHYTLLWNDSSALNEKDEFINISSLQSWFSINSTTGEICVSSELDRETAEKVTLRILVEDINAEVKPQTATGTLTVTILDVNDNAPNFTLGTTGNIELSVSESTPVGTDLATITAFDIDKNNEITFTLLDTDVFNITSKGQLLLANPLDRETINSYNVTVVATDDGKPQNNSNATIIITVLDSNDNDPVFNMTQTTFYIFENETNGTVATMNASDADIGPNANITYINYNKWDNKFRMNRTNGTVYLIGSLDREKVASYSFEITAHDNPTSGDRRKSKITITFNITDINDNGPVFKQDKYKAAIPEDEPVNKTISVTPGNIISATDEDIGINAKIKYSFEKTNISGLFRIDENSGEVYVSESLLGKAENYTITVIATDQGVEHHKNSTTLVIEVRDKNLNRPKFVNTFKLPKVPECARIGTSVYQFSATDADKDPYTNGRVEYRFDNSTNNDFNFLKLDHVSGELTIAKNLNREEKQALKIRVEAYDLGIPSLTVLSPELTIEISDVNDNPPKFDNSSKQVIWNVTENTSNVTLGTIKAYDPDSDSRMCYNMLGSEWIDHLKIKSPDNTTAEIHITEELDRETVAEFRFNMTVKDCSSIDTNAACTNDTFHFMPDQLEVKVIVVDQNDNPPHFTKSKISTGLRQKVEVGKIVFKFQDYVTDLDIGRNKIHKYTMPSKMKPNEQLEKTFDTVKYKEPFIMNENGIMKTNMKFSEDMVGCLSSTVLVSDSAGQDNIQVKIYIIADYQVLKLTFNQAPDDLNKIKHKIKQTLDKETGLEFVINDEIASTKDKDGNVKKYQSNLFVHAVNPKTEHILDASNLREIMDFHSTLTRDLIRMFNLYQVQEDVPEPSSMNNTERLQYILGGVIAFLVFVVCLVAFFYFNSIRRYKRKLKAATTEVYAMDSTKAYDNGTCKDSVFNENPIFNKDIGGQDFEDNISVTSVNSLDKNQVDSDRFENVTDEQEVTMDMYDDKALDTAYPSRGFLSQALQHHDHDLMAAESRGSGAEETASQTSESDSRKKPSQTLDLKQFSDIMNHNLESSDI